MRKRRWVSKFDRLYSLGLLFVIVAGTGGAFLFQRNRMLTNRVQVGDLYLKKANALMQHDRFDEAADALEKARLADPENFHAEAKQLELAIFKMAREFDPPNRFLKLERLDKAEADCLSLLRANPESAEVTALLGIIYAYKDQPAKAIETYQRASQMKPDYPNVSNYWGYTVYQWEIPDWERIAAQKFKDAQKLDSNYAWPRINLSLLTALNGKFEDAIKILRQAEEFAKDNETLYTLWGSCLRLWGEQLKSTDKLEAYKKFSEALDKYRISETLNPNVAYLHFNKAHTLADLESLDAAISEYNKAIELEPDFAAARIDLADLQLARKEPNQKDMEGAVAQLKEAIRFTEKTNQQFKERKAKTPDTHAQKMLDQWVHDKELEIGTLEKKVAEVTRQLANISRNDNQKR